MLWIAPLAKMIPFDFVKFRNALQSRGEKRSPEP